MSLDQYYYLISSLPALSLEQAGEFDSGTFLEYCRDCLPEARFRELIKVSLIPSGEPVCQVDAEWQAWETYLRNLLVWNRCHHTGCEQAHQWIRPESDVFPSIVRRIDEAMSENTPLEREQILDQLRWQALDNLATGHQFDFEALVIYRLRLLIVEKWQSHDTERGREAFSQLTDALFQQALEARR